MKFMVLIYNDPELLGAVPQQEFDETMRGCIDHAVDLQGQGYLIESQQLEPPTTARSIRVRNGK
ncbi:MAG: YciI family protein, partial [Gemmatimonadaceae bacterium]